MIEEVYSTMATSGKTGRLAQPRRVPLSVSRYDVLLAFVPVVFFVATLVGLAMSIPVEIALAVAALASAVVVADALFLNPPISRHGPS